MRPRSPASPNTGKYPVLRELGGDPVAVPLFVPDASTALAVFHGTAWRRPKVSDETFGRISRTPAAAMYRPLDSYYERIGG